MLEAYRIEAIDDEDQKTDCDMCERTEATHVFSGFDEGYHFWVKVCGICLDALKKHAEKENAEET